MSKSESFAICVHAHQPVGNFESVLRDAYERCYRPFFEVWSRRPEVRLTCHFSGSLLDWLEKNEPAFLRSLRDPLSSGRLEVLGGAYYEAVYGMIPPRDLRGQLLLMNERIEKLFGARPTGAWLTERVWDPGAADALSAAGLRYTVVDDHHLSRAGVQGPYAGCYRVKGTQGSVEVFAALKELRYRLPFSKADDAVETVRRQAASGRPAVFADDLEKFGLWPGTHRWVYAERWLDRFFEKLGKSGVRTVTLRQAHEENADSAVEVHLEHGSYPEMMDWSGGDFRNFFDRYTESAYMRDRMIGVSEAVQAAGEEGRQDPARLREASRSLYRAQCNCAYWHGVFGGLYLHHLRSAVFENLIAAERSALNGSLRPVRAERLASGVRLRLQSERLGGFFNPGYGAALEELDHLPSGRNLLCTLQRRREEYHGILSRNGSATGPASALHRLLGTKTPGLEKRLWYDRQRRLSFLDRFFEKPVEESDFLAGRYVDTGEFADQSWGMAVEEEKGGAAAVFRRTARAQIGKRPEVLAVVKTARLKRGDTLSVEYRFRPVEARGSAVFGLELNFSIGWPSQGKIKDYGVRTKTLSDPWSGLDLTIGSEDPFDLIAVPVETVSGSEAGLDSTYQGMALLVQTRLQLDPQRDEVRTFDLTVGGPAS
ncbi:MAG: Alpha-amylase 1 [Candidatus Omnitrophica bacterium]|nr:Alpha-amylase 1 [Candidatus Omnitrophota bacterium]